MPSRSYGVAIGTGLALVILLALLSIAYGSTVIPLGDVIAALAHAVGLDAGSVAAPVEKIIVDLRLPRAILAICVGAGLAVVGALLQTVTRNDLADPFLFGLSSGAAAGAVSVITVFGDRLGVWTLPIAAFVGGILTAFVVLLLVNRIRGQGPERLILAGLAVSFLFTALTNYLVFAGDQRAAHSVLFWTMGGLGLARWGNIGLAVAGAAVILTFALRYHRWLDAFLAGENTAESLGVPVPRFRTLTFLAAALSTAILVSVAGVIGFVGLMIPHVARRFAGPLHLRLAIACAVFGAVLLLASDLLARTLLPPQELPIGIITSSIGALFVVATLLRKRF
ncbi:MAG TPA: iron ABC transporter permease [Mesorhizobium sp.]|uniref:FecCD family ABC transporter permease n=1 Tax=Mesorhizobium sp. TaxID=1871066 RepID=UPI002DDD72AD|nr:iron ABC transporter permease [Mesorhizobium sp.]HEV2504791.1 iron ABC transporter permease [Mesorhizobium sp.]